MRRWILFVEDDPDDRALMRWAMARHGLEGYEVVEAGDGVEGQRSLEQRQAEPPIMVITDLKLPRISGVELLRWIAAQPWLRNTVKVAVTSSADSRDRDECLRCGASRFLSKPMSLEGYEKLVAELKGILP